MGGLIPLRSEQLHIGYVNQDFPPEVGAGPARVLELSKRWQASGARVTVITGMPNRRIPERGEGGIDKRYRGKYFMVEEWEGVRVLRSWLFTGSGRGTVTKLVNNATFMVSAFFHALVRRERFDVLIGSSPPFLSQISAVWLGQIHQTPVVLEIRDLWPDYMVELGMLNNEIAQSALFGVERWLFQKADHTVVVTESFRKRVIEKGVFHAATDVIPNGVDLGEYFSATEPPPPPLIRRRPGEFLVGYLGTIGKGQALEVLVRAAKTLAASSPEIRFVLVGDGPQKPAVQAEIQKLALQNISLHPPIVRKQTRAFYNGCDVCIVPLAPVPIFSETVPSKIFEVMACERPLIACVAGEAQQVVQTSGAGIVVSPGDANALAAAIIRVQCMDDSSRRAMGARGRQYVAANYDRNSLAERYLKILQRLARRGAIAAEKRSSEEV